MGVLVTCVSLFGLGRHRRQQFRLIVSFPLVPAVAVQISEAPAGLLVELYAGFCRKGAQQLLPHEVLQLMFH
jgi:hypothetical protein